MLYLIFLVFTNLVPSADVLFLKKTRYSQAYVITYDKLFDLSIYCFSETKKLDYTPKNKKN